ncbi:hypothetical protein, conserved [Babesia bigemina]|uniref:Uncharacterized protein n=1 Tax=Babesia bigemina TaxID=5866 RepID=A0A061D5I9_BABBI|nr:hypothetical protein, conserved [Babesia bigemina]CDR94229.1 hypothetical protein, conserved [Babesia bigemina]|eukprot:XP_012766415.1 hypothetical protein, conserved [Babesia bigemina]
MSSLTPKAPKNTVASAEKSHTNDLTALALQHSGIRLPDRTGLLAEITAEDYDFAVANINHEYNALFTLLQRLRFEKLRKLTSQDGWNPFDLQFADVCTPIPIGDVENYSYDEQTSSCRCPNKLLPCSRHQALNDLEIWTYQLRKLLSQSKFSTRYDRLKLATKHLNIINSKGILLQAGLLDNIAIKRKQICNSVDAVLCSMRDHSRASTEWSSWGGCSEKCNRGTQERFKITYNNGVREFVVDRRTCELTKCSDLNQPNVSQCLISIVPRNKSTNAVVRTCACPTEDSVMCSSEEARITMDSWITQFREYCKKALIHNEGNNILHKDIPQLNTQYLGRFVQIRFRDGYYFDCTERWGMIDNDDTTSYCKIGSPILCREHITKSNARAFTFKLSKTYNKKFMGFVAPLHATDVDFIDIHFRDSLFDVTYNIYGKQIHSIWLYGTILSVDYDKELFDFNDGSGRILQIKFGHTFVNSFAENEDVIKKGSLVSIICGLSHVIVEQDALLCLRVLAKI